MITPFVVYYLQDGIVGFCPQLAPLNLKRPVAVPLVEGAAPPADAVATTASRGADGEILQAHKVLMQFGGLKALHDVDLVVKRGAIHGLIGPNVSGKRQHDERADQHLRAPTRQADVRGKTLVGRTPSDIALSGIARTFQNVQLFAR